MPPLPHAQLWALAIPAILNTLNKVDHVHLGGYPAKSAAGVASGTNILKGSWSITTRDQLLSMMTWLRDEGTQAEYRQAVQRWGGATVEDRTSDRELAFVQQYSGELGNKGILAFDLCRVVSMAGWGFLAGMLNEAEAWDWTMAAARRLRSDYRSWAEVGRGYALGCRFWNEKFGPECDATVQQLLKDPNSPWSTIPWDIDFDTEPGARARLMWRLASCLVSVVIGSVILVLVVAFMAGLILYILTTSNMPAPRLSLPDRPEEADEAAWDGHSPFSCGGGDEVTLQGITADAGVSAAGSCQLTLIDMHITAPVAITAGGGAIVVVKGGRIEGTEAAVSAGGGSTVTFEGTEVVGEKKRAGGAKIEGP